MNAANLLLARGAERGREIALRRSLGASSGRVVRQLVTETATLAVAGGIVGAGLAWLLIGVVREAAAGILPRPTAIEFDGTVVGVALLVTAVVTTLAGVLPALRVARGGSFEGLRGGAREVGDGTREVRQRRILVAAEVALAVVLLVGSGLLVRSFNALSTVDTGLASEGAVAMRLNAPAGRYPDVESRRALYDQILEGVRAGPGVTVAGATASLPMRGVGEGWGVLVPGLFDPPPDERQIARLIPTSDGGFEALGMRLLGGRGIAPSDGPADPQVAVVNETMVRDFFQGEDPVGRVMTDVSGTVHWEVVGVVNDVRVNGPGEGAPPSFYVPLAQYPRLAEISFVARTDGDPLALVPWLESAVRSADEDQPITEIVTLERLTSQATARPAFFASVMTGFGALALVLAALGIYGVLAYIVRGRRREMGLRSALGATRVDVVGLVMGDGLRPALAGLVVGLGGAAFLSRYLQSLLFQVEPLDAVSFVAGTVVLALAAATACAVPAAWAARADPMVSLRGE